MRHRSIDEWSILVLISDIDIECGDWVASGIPAAPST